MQKIREILSGQPLIQLKKTSHRKVEKLLDFSDRSSQKKYYGTAPVSRETVLINTIQLHIKININGKIGNIIIDFDIIENFIIKRNIENKEYSI